LRAGRDAARRRLQIRPLGRQRHPAASARRRRHDAAGGVAPMTPSVVLLVLCAAVLHATWNAVLRSGADRLRSITVMTNSSRIAAVPMILVLPRPAGQSWFYILLSAALHVGYNLFLVTAYRQGELGQVYPIARGSSPLLVTLGALLFAGERLSLL